MDTRKVRANPVSRESGRAHYVKHNAITRVPRAYVYLDTEAQRTEHPTREVQSFRLGVAAFDARSKDHVGWQPREWCRSTEYATLWEWITSKCRSKARTVLVAHNLSYDLRISHAFTELPRLGWEFVNGRLDDGQVWVLYKKGDRTLICVDTLSWVPKNLETLGGLVGFRKCALPAWADDDAAWFKRCIRDVEILGEVWRRLITWVEVDDLGQWKFSGAGQSWAALRHRFYTHKLFVHADDDARSAERRAAMTGRCEAWKHGRLIDGPYQEWDFTTAYARIGVECDVPTTLVGEARRATLADVLKWSKRRAVLCDVTVTTDVPVLSYRDDAGIRWPVGTFRTTCWENELTVAVADGARVTIERAWVYRRAPALRAFCTWILEGLDGSRGDVDPVIRVALKHWSRAIVGRMAAQWTRWEVWGESPRSDVSMYSVHDGSDDERFNMMQLGHQLVRERGKPENPDAMVAVMSWIMAESRVRLWDAMQVAELDNVVYVDTDSVITTPAGSMNLQRAHIPGLRIKSEYADLEILGPRQIVPNGVLRAAGVPRGARRVDSATWSAEVWGGLSRSLRTGQVSEVEVARRTFQLQGVDKRRLHVDAHETDALTVTA